MITEDELVSPAAAKQYYEDFSHAAGLRDWLRPNRRHEALKLLVADALADRGRRPGLRLLDVGCGGGVLTHHLRRYGAVTGIDFSSAAIEAARRIAPGVDLHVGSLADLPGDATFDVITLFDVLEHIPPADRPALFVELRSRLNDDGIVFLSTPHPIYTAYRRAQHDETLQIIDELVELPTVITEAGAAGLQLLSYEVYDVFKGSPEYQAFVLAPAREPGGPVAIPVRGHRRRMQVVGRPVAVRARRVRHAVRLARHGHRDEARWFLRGKAPSVKS